MDWKDFVAIVAVPALGFAYWLAWDARKKAEDAEARLSQFMIEVAQKYASVAYLKDVEDRLVKMIAEVKSSVEKMGDKLDRLLDRGGAE